MITVTKIKNNSIIGFMEIITINDKSHNNIKKHLRKKTKKRDLFYPNYEETASPNMQRKYHVY